MEATEFYCDMPDGTIEVDNGFVHYCFDIADLQEACRVELVSRAHIIKDLDVTLDELLNSSMHIEVNISVSPSQDTSAYLKVTSEHINGNYELPLTSDEEKGVYTDVLVKLHKDKALYEKWESEASTILKNGASAK